MKDGMPVEFPAVTICNIATISFAKVNNMLTPGPDMIKWFHFIEATNFGEHASRMNSHQAFF
jgi:acid-sensing ion channel 2